MLNCMGSVYWKKSKLVTVNLAASKASLAGKRMARSSAKDGVLRKTQVLMNLRIRPAAARTPANYHR